MTTQQTNTPTLDIRDCGLANYSQILEMQLQLHEFRHQNKIPNTAIIVEHRPVITLGARQSTNKLLLNAEELKAKGIDVVDIRRGGGTTAHNPGQLVFYPIVHLGQLGLGVSEYVRTLEQIGIELLEDLGVTAERKKGFPGLWVGEKKIASIGVRVSKQVTYHGMAININNDLSIFDYIIPCGLENITMTSVQRETGKTCDIPEAQRILSHLLTTHFSKDAKRESRRLPAWLRRRAPVGKDHDRTARILSQLGLETICTNANCPNRGECWARGTATVLILGNICTRNCKFCSVPKGKPKPPDPTEPTRIAQLAKKLDLKYLVITSVDRDDLPDGGASHFRNCISEVRSRCPDVQFEILTPDFRNCQKEAIEILARELLATEITEKEEKNDTGRGEHRDFVFAHNIETVPSLYPKARMGGDYQRSLDLLKLAKENYDGVPTKSSIMLGLGETDTEVEQVLKDLRSVGVDRITIGQYLKPSKDSLEVVEYITPEKFDWWKNKALELGFKWVISAPFARSSYFAEMTTTV